MQLFGFGSNGSGQLGVGHQDDIDAPRICLFEQVDDSELLRVVASGNTTFLLFQSGCVYYAGDRQYDGPSSKDASIEDGTKSSAFRLLELDQGRTAKNCSATWEASLIVTKSEEVWVCGAGTKGELGLGFGRTESSSYTRLSMFPVDDVSIVDIASSVSHSVVVLSNGEVYGWGNGRKGQIGEPAGVVWTPRKIQGLDFNVVRAVCGREFTFLLGHPQSGISKVLGADKWNVRSNMPKHLPEWRDVGASWNSVSLLTKEEGLLTWGRDDRGQLGPDDLPKLQAIAVGSEHSIAITLDFDVLCWGWGEHGNCGSRVDADGRAINSPRAIAMPNSLHHFQVGLGAGCATSFVWLLTGSESKQAS